GLEQAVWGGGGPGVEATWGGSGGCGSQAREVSSAGDEAGAGEVRGRRGRAVWADSGGRTFGERRRDGDRCGDAAAMDAVGRAVEPTTQAKTVSSAPGATAALWGVGADGRELSRLVGGAWSGRLHDEH